MAWRGVDVELACQVSEQLSRHDALAAHARIRHGIDPDELTNPWHAGLASMLAFIVGGMIPLGAILLSARDIAVWATTVAVVSALAITGVVSAHLGGAAKLRASMRTIGDGILAMAITSAVGSLLGTQL